MSQQKVLSSYPVLADSLATLTTNLPSHHIFIGMGLPI